MTHECPATGCDREIRYEMLMCPAHWRMVSPPVRTSVWNAWDGGAGAGTTQHAAAISAAIRSVNEKLAAKGITSGPRRCAMTAITVTAQHITKGKRENCERCPVALAIRDAFPDLAYISVGPEGLIVQHRDGTPEICVDVPPEVLDFIWTFDDGGDVEPFTFTVDYPAVTA